MAGLYLTKCISMQGVGLGMVSGGRGACKARTWHGVRLGRQVLAVLRYRPAAGASVRRPAVMGVGMAGGRGGRSPRRSGGGGGEWGPHTKESIRCIPQSGTLKNQKESLFRSHRSA